MSLKYALRLHKAQNAADEHLFPLFCRFLSLFKRKGGLPEKPKRILFIRFSGLGDAIQSLPTIKRLKEKFPRASIAVLCVPRNKEAFQHQKLIDDVLVMARSSMPLSIPLYILRNFRSFDLCIDTEEGFRLAAMLSFFLSKRTIGFSYKEGNMLYDASVKGDESEHGVTRLAKLLLPLGIKFKPKELVPLNTSEQYRKLIEVRFQQLGINPKKDLLVGIHAFAAPTSVWRAYPPERVVELIKQLRAGGCKIALTGISSDSTTAKQVIAAVGDPSWLYDFSDLPSDALFYLISKYSLLISIDSGPMHIAAAQGVPVIGLFGPKPPSVSGPYPLSKFVVFHKIPKGHKHEWSKAWAHGCAPEYIKQITVDEIYSAARKILGIKVKKAKFSAKDFLIRAS